MDTDDAYKYHELPNLVIRLSCEHLGKKSCPKTNMMPTKTVVEAKLPTRGEMSKSQAALSPANKGFLLLPKCDLSIGAIRKSAGAISALPSPNNTLRSAYQGVSLNLQLQGGYL